MKYNVLDFLIQLLNHDRLFQTAIQVTI